MATKKKAKKPRKKTSKPQYVGTSGQLAMMAELSYRGYNVAIPLIDIGDDIFAVNHKTNETYRVQVKTSKPRSSKAIKQRTISFLFNIKKSAFNLDSKTPFIALVMRIDDNWKFCVMSFDTLRTLIDTNNIGTLSGENYLVYLSWNIMSSKLSAGGGKSKIDLTKYLTEWHTRFADINN